MRRRIARLRDSGKPRQVDAAMRSLFVLAYTIRFLAAALGAVETG